MKILCLHGNGTNAHIMRLQTAPLRYELEDGHEYEFVEAVLKAPISEGVETLSSPDSSFYAFYNPENLPASFRQSLDQLHGYILAEGPFDAVMGFSAGAVLAASYLAEQQALIGDAEKRANHTFKCGIFILSTCCKDAAKVLEGKGFGVGEDLVQIPSVHVWGTNNNLVLAVGADLSQFFDPAQRLILVHDGGHEFRRGTVLAKAVQFIRRMIDQAETGTCE